MMKTLFASMLVLATLHLIVKGKKYSDKYPLPDGAAWATWEKIGHTFKWTSILLCLVGTYLFQAEYWSFIKHQNKSIDGPDWDLFWAFMIFVLPALVLVAASLYIHLAVDMKTRSKRKSKFDRLFVFASAMSILVALAFVTIANHQYGIVF